MSTTIDSPRDRLGSADGVEYVVHPPRHFEGNVYECRVLICPEDDGGFSSHAVRLPGVVSQGETEADALAGIAEAFRGALRVYRDLGEDVPWGDAEIENSSAKERWILVDV
jgi:predicted RNase H-like HicB family nuclease